MNSRPHPVARARSGGRTPRAQHGVVLFIALLVMVALSLAGIALIRSADTATIVAGNLAFKQAAASAVDRGFEQAIEALFDPVANITLSNPVIANKADHLLTQNYFACVQAEGGGCLPAGSPIPEIPTLLTARRASLQADLVPVDAAGNRSSYVIERMCANTGAPVSANCNLWSPARGADAGTQHYEGLVLPGGPFFRVTVRVDGPRNTVAFAQAILR